MIREGRPRSVVAVILYSIVTFGFYWYYWIWRAFAEVIEVHERRRWPPWPVLAIVGLNLTAILVPWLVYDQDPLATPSPLDGLTTAFLVAETLTLLITIIEVLYLFAATNRLLTILGETTHQDKRPHATLILGFALTSLWWLPKVGLLVGVAGLAVILVWFGDVQLRINAYWKWRKGNELPYGTSTDPGTGSTPSS